MLQQYPFTNTVLLGNSFPTLLLYCLCTFFKSKFSYLIFVLLFYFVCNQPLCCSYFFALLFPYVFCSISFLFLIPYVSQTFMRDVPYLSCISRFLFTLIFVVFVLLYYFSFTFYDTFFIPLCFLFYFISFSRSYNFYMYPATYLLTHPMVQSPS